MLSIVALPLLFSLQAPAPPAPVPERYRLVHVDPSEVASRPQLLPRLGFDHIATDPASGALELTVNPAEFAALRENRVRYEVVIDDLAAFYASRLTAGTDAPPTYGAWLTPPFGSGAMGGYYTFSQVESVLDQVHAAYPALTTAKASIGTSLEGRTLWMLKVSDNPGIDENEPEFRIDSLHHAREPEGMQSSLWYMLYLLESYASDPLAKYLVDSRETFFVLVTNPDGYVYNQTTNPGGGGMWRKNRRNNGDGTFGVDLNRNYNDHWAWDNTGSSPTTSSETYRGTAAASEPEVAAMQAFIGSRSFASSLSLHTYGNLWLYPFGYAQIYPANNTQYVEVSTLATEVNHYQVGPPSFILYTANGVTVDYDHDVKGTLSWTPEIGTSTDGFWPPTSRIVPLAEENLLALQRTALAGGAWMRVLSTTLTEVGDGDGYYEVGESVNLTSIVRNSGRAASGTNVVLTLTSPSPFATITNGTYNFGAVAGFTQASSSAMSIAIGAGASGSIAYTLTLSYEGWSQVVTGSLPIGQPIPYVIDDAESNWGWTMGVAGDTATSGLWTRGVPIGTSSSGQPASPSADNTPVPGTQCFMTGNGGGSAGNDDVDNGTTTLLSPLIDLSNCGPARLSFARWFADLTVADDVFAISISNDGGQSWVPLENVAGNANAWTMRTFEVTNFLPQTSRMRLRFAATDLPNNSIVEAAIDDLRVEITDGEPRLNFYGKPTAGGTVRANLTGPPGASFALQMTLQNPLSPGNASPYIDVGLSITPIAGVIPSSQLATVPISVPSGAAWVGRTIWYHGLVSNGTTSSESNWASFTVE